MKGENYFLFQKTSLSTIRLNLAYLNYKCFSLPIYAIYMYVINSSKETLKDTLNALKDTLKILFNIF